VYVEDFALARAVPRGRLRTTVGSWDVGDKCLRRARGGTVLWRKFQIAPYVTHDPPSVLAWLQDEDLAGLGSFVVEVATRRSDEAHPRLAVTIHGEERDDGLSGHTFVVKPGGEGLVVTIEEYDRPVYSVTANVHKGVDHVFRFARRERSLSCSVDGRVLVEGVDLAPLPRDGIGLMTWDRETGIARVRVERVK
jgi:hypothetical protein